MAITQRSAPGTIDQPSLAEFSINPVAQEASLPPRNQNDLHVAVLNSAQEFAESVDLTRQQFLRVGHITSDMQASHDSERHPSSATFAVKNVAGEIVMRATLVFSGTEDKSPSLPCQIQPEFNNIINRKYGLKAEVTRMASQNDQSKIGQTQLLMEEIALLALSLDVHSIFLVCHPEHADFYVKCFDADALATVDSYAGVKDKPGVLMEITVADFHHFTRWAPKACGVYATGGFYSQERRRIVEAYNSRFQSKTGSDGISDKNEDRSNE